MHPGQRLTHPGTVRGVGLARPDAFQKSDDRRRTAGQRAQRFAAFVLHRLRTIDAVAGQMRHQAEKERQIALGDALLVQRQNKISGRGVQQEIVIFHALGDALVGQQFADVVMAQNLRKLAGGDVGIYRHRDYSAASGRSERGNGKNSFSSAAETVSTCNSYRSANAPMISSTITSGAEAPAVMPSVLMPSNRDQSRSPARCASTAIGQPSRSATSRRRCEFDEFGAPTTIRASTTGATFFTASWRLVVA